MRTSVSFGRAGGSMFGLAYGDALGAPTEFLNMKQIRRRFGEDGPSEPTGAASSGDSDSIACLAGAFAGAHLGMDAWPAGWATRIEYADTLTKIGSAWD